MNRRGVALRVLGVSSVVVGLCGLAAAQTPVPATFRTSKITPLSGDFQGTLPTLQLVDVGDPQGGPPDGLLDAITGNVNAMQVGVLLGNGDGTFAAGPSSDLGTIPTAIYAAKFDDDAAPDLLVCDSAGMVRFLKGNNDGTFAAPGEPLDVKQSLVAITAADFDGDGRLDAAVLYGPDTATGSVTILQGLGDGTFSIGASFETGVSSREVLATDINGDGKIDLAVTNAGDSTVNILYGNGHGAFPTTEIVDLGAGQPREPAGIAARDMNGDGRLDLVVGIHNTDEVAIVDGKAGGSFATARFYVSGSARIAPTSIAVDDLNGDGKLDVVTANNLSSDSSVLLGDGHGNLGAPRSFVSDQDPLAVAIADFNGDHIPDVASVTRGRQDTNTSSLAVLLGQGDGTLAGVEDVNLYVQSDSIALATGDVDNDGVPDLLVGYTDGTVELHRANPGQGFAAPGSFLSPVDLALLQGGDFNGDGLLDIVTVSKAATPTTNLTLYLGKLTGGFGPPQPYAVGSGPQAIAVGDWNRDGRSDIAVCGQGSGSAGTVEILLGGADGTLIQPSPHKLAVGNMPTAADFGDFTGDGNPDLVVSNNQSVTLLKGNGDGTFQAATTITAAGGATALVVADFDGDGKDDLAVAHPNSMGIVVLFGDGNGGLAAVGQPLATSGQVSGLTARDINGDVVPDILFSDQVNSNVRMLVSSGATRRFSSGARNFTTGRQPLALGVGDFDGDGRYDVTTLNILSATTASVLTNLQTKALIRGDANTDGTVTAADLPALIRELASSGGARIERVQVAHASYAAGGIDANGDGVLTRQDVFAVVHRLFPRL